MAMNGEGNGKPLQYSWFENPMKGMTKYSASMPVNGASMGGGRNLRGGALGLEAPSPPCLLPAPSHAHPQAALFFIPGYLPWKYYKTSSCFPS